MGVVGGCTSSGSMDAVLNVTKKVAVAVAVVLLLSCMRWELLVWML
jgi:hypothetical protein